MSTEKLVSVIVPVYNTEKFLHKCLNSIIRQTYKNIEIIVINDGSRDNSEKVILDYQKFDKRIRYYAKENGGLSSARNYALDIARGEYLVFVDSDDWIDERLIFECINDSVIYNSDIVCFGFTMMIDGSGYSYKKCCNDDGHLLLNTTKALDLLIEEDIIQSHVCSKFLKKFLFDNIRFPVGKNYEDSYITHNLFLRSKIITHINKPYYYYLLRNESICHTPSESNLLDMVGSHVRRYVDLEEYLDNAQKEKLLLGIKKYYIKARRYLAINENLKEYELWIEEKSKATDSKKLTLINILFTYARYDNFLIKVAYKVKNFLQV